MIAVYKIECVENGKLYIGITSDIRNRLKVHFNSKKNTLISRAMRKYGRERFNIDIIDSVDSWEEAWGKEKYYIKSFNSYKPNGYNMTYGGEGQPGLVHTEETRKKMSLSHIGKGCGKDNPMYGKAGSNLGKKFSYETRMKISESKKGNIPWNKGKKSDKPSHFKGKHHSDETKRLISESSKGRKWSDKTRAKMLNSREGRYVFGSGHGCSKLDDNKVKEIRSKYHSKEFNQKELSLMFNVTQSMISCIVLNKNWTHI